MMNSKEALENVKTAPSFMGGNPRYWTCLQSSIPFLEDINTIKQDLDKLEKLEKENEKLKCKIHDLLDEKLELVLNNHNQSMGIAELMKKFIEFKKVIEILKGILIVEGFTRENGSETYFLTERNKFPVYTINLTEEQYNLLKEVL